MLLTDEELTEAREDTLPSPLGSVFDYDLTNPADAMARDAARRINELRTKAVESIVAIGGELARVKQALGHGRFLAWLDAEFSMTDRSARNYIAMHETFKSETVSDLAMMDVGAAYKLASPSVPSAVRDAAIRMAKAGQRVTLATVKELRDKPAGAPGPAARTASADREAVEPSGAAGAARPDADEDDDTEVIMAAVASVYPLTTRYKTRRELVEILELLEPIALPELSRRVSKLTKWVGWLGEAVALAKRNARTCREFRVRAGMMGAKEPRHAATQRAEDT